MDIKNELLFTHFMQAYDSFTKKRDFHCTLYEQNFNRNYSLILKFKNLQIKKKKELD